MQFNICILHLYITNKQNRTSSMGVNVNCVLKYLNLRLLTFVMISLTRKKIIQKKKKKKNLRINHISWLLQPVTELTRIETIKEVKIYR